MQHLDIVFIIAFAFNRTNTLPSVTKLSDAIKKTIEEDICKTFKWNASKNRSEIDQCMKGIKTLLSHKSKVDFNNNILKAFELHNLKIINLYQVNATRSNMQL